MINTKYDVQTEYVEDSIDVRIVARFPIEIWEEFLTRIEAANIPGVVPHYLSTSMVELIARENCSSYPTPNEEPCPDYVPRPNASEVSLTSTVDEMVEKLNKGHLPIFDGEKS